MHTAERVKLLAEVSLACFTSLFPHMSSRAVTLLLLWVK